MNYYKIGKRTLNLRKESNMTQKEMTNLLHASDQTISKWDCANGISDISLLSEITSLFNINIEKLMNKDLSLNRFTLL